MSKSTARPCNIEWIRSIVGQCKAAGVACFTKQLGTKVVGEFRSCCGDYWLNNSRPAECAKCGDRGGPGTVMRTLKDKKGGDMAEFPEDLRVREFPNV